MGNAMGNNARIHAQPSIQRADALNVVDGPSAMAGTDRLVVPLAQGPNTFLFRRQNGFGNGFGRPPAHPDSRRAARTHTPIPQLGRFFAMSNKMYHTTPLRSNAAVTTAPAHTSDTPFTRLIQRPRDTTALMLPTAPDPRLYGVARAQRIAANEARNFAIFSTYRGSHSGRPRGAGPTLTELGRAHGLSRARVWQIVIRLLNAHRAMCARADHATALRFAYDAVDLMSARECAGGVS